MDDNNDIICLLQIFAILVILVFSRRIIYYVWRKTLGRYTTDYDNKVSVIQDEHQQQLAAIVSNLLPGCVADVAISSGKSTMLCRIYRYTDTTKINYLE